MPEGSSAPAPLGSLSVNENRDKGRCWKMLARGDGDEAGSDKKDNRNIKTVILKGY